MLEIVMIQEVKTNKDYINLPLKILEFQVFREGVVYRTDHGKNIPTLRFVSVEHHKKSCKTSSRNTSHRYRH